MQVYALERACLMGRGVGCHLTRRSNEEYHAVKYRSDEQRMRILANEPCIVRRNQTLQLYSGPIFRKMCYIEQTSYRDYEITHSPTVTEHSRSSSSSKFGIRKRRHQP